MITIIDYDAGNIRSVEKACEYLGFEPKLSRDPRDILEADRIILPGDGNFGFAMEMLAKYELTDLIKDVIASGKMFLGICLGLQLLYEESEESPGADGLGIIKGKVLGFDRNAGLKVPQIGWNELEVSEKSRLFRGIESGSHVYFVHSFYGHAEDPDNVAAYCTYGARFDASIESGNLFACQFHPEKSGETGLKILNNFLTM